MDIFYKKEVKKDDDELSEDESRHCALVLRHKVGGEILIYDGKGGKHCSRLTKVSKNRCEFEVISSTKESSKGFYMHIAIAPTKNMDRMEWIVEKLSEIGLDELTFIKTQNSERRKMRTDRLEKKAISAMKQSKNPFKLKMNSLMPFEDFIRSGWEETKFIAHVDPQCPYLASCIGPLKPILVLVGPEGGFTKKELQLAENNGFQPISLGKSKLRTETAGLVACCIINFVNES